MVPVYLTPRSLLPASEIERLFFSQHSWLHLLRLEVVEYITRFCQLVRQASPLRQIRKLTNPRATRGNIHCPFPRGSRGFMTTNCLSQLIVFVIHSSFPFRHAFSLGTASGEFFTPSANDTPLAVPVQGMFRQTDDSSKPGETFPTNGI